MDKHYYIGYNKNIDATANDTRGWTIYVFSDLADLREFMQYKLYDRRYRRINKFWADSLWRHSHVTNYSK